MGKVTKKKLEKYGWVIHKTYSQYVRHPNFAKNSVSYCTEYNQVTSLDKLFTPCRTMKELKAYVLKETGEEMLKLESKEQLEKKFRNVGFVNIDRDYFDLWDKTCIKIRVNTDEKYFTYFNIGGGFSVIDWQSFKNFKDLRNQVKKLTGIDIKKKGNDDKSEETALKDISGNGNHLCSKENDEPSWEVESLPTVWVLEAGDYSMIDERSELDSDYYDFTDEINHNLFPANPNYARAMQALPQLLVMRDVYRQGWVPDWSENNQKGIACIIKKSGKVVGNENFSWYAFLSFQTAEIRDKFLKCFRQQIEDYFAMF